MAGWFTGFARAPISQAGLAADHAKALPNPLSSPRMHPANALRSIANSLAALLRGGLRSRAVLLVLVALLNTAQGIVCNLHDVSHIGIAATAHASDGVVDFSHAHASDLLAASDITEPLDIEAHCLHISCVHSPAFAASPMVHEFMQSISAAPTSGPRLPMPMPPLGANFRPPRAA